MIKQFAKGRVAIFDEFIKEDKKITPLLAGEVY